jgi:hypothetical protein
MQEIGMADSGTIDKRDFSSPALDEDDPLMELSRIIGLEPRRESLSRYAPAPRIEPDFDRPVDTEALELPASPEISDVLQQDLAEELIASLESEDGFSALDAEEHAAAPVEMAAYGVDDLAGPEAPVAANGEGPNPHIEMSPPSSAAISGSLEDELEAILNPVASQHVPFGMRPADDAPEVPATVDDFEAPPLEDQLASRPVMTFDDGLEFGSAGARDEAVYEDAAPEKALFEEEDTASEPVKSGPSDFWSRAAHRSVNVPADAPSHIEAVEAEAGYLESAPVEEQVAVAASVIDSAPVRAPQFEPIVDVIAHEARGVEMTGDLDVPDFDYAAEEKSQSASASDEEYDSEYSPSYQQPDAGPALTPAPSVPAARYEDEDYDQFNEANAGLEQERDYSSSSLGHAAAVAAAASMSRQDQTRHDFVLDDDDNFGASLEVPHAPAAAVRRSSGRSYLMAAGLGALALVGGIGAYALTRGGDNTVAAAVAPVVLKADSSPVKVAPETPGGKVVPNQDIAVFDKAAGDKPVEAAQTELVSNTETPVDLAEKTAPRVVLPGPAKTDPALQETDAAAAEPDLNAKSEERVIEQPADDASLVKTEVVSVSPKKVRTMVVKSDGSLEERAAATVAKAPAPDPVEAALVAPAESAVPAKKVQTSAVTPSDAVGTVPKAADPAPAKAEELTNAAIAAEAAAEPAADAGPAAAEAAPTEVKPVVKTVKVKKLTQKAAKAEALKEVAAANIPLVDARPSDQPVTIVAKTGKTPQAADQVAALTPAPAQGGSYVIQIASATSPDAAQATWASLNRRFGNVLGGRSAKIQKADIPGKGTFYRVRIPAGSKQEAAALCAKYKSAGGQCLVSR